MINVTLSNMQLNKLKPASNNATDVTLRWSLNMIGIFLHNLLLIDKQVSTLCMAFVNKSSVKIKFKYPVIP